VAAWTYKRERLGEIAGFLASQIFKFPGELVLKIAFSSIFRGFHYVSALQWSHSSGLDYLFQGEQGHLFAITALWF